MTSKKNDFEQPVAYDAEGRPLYAHPASHIKKQAQAVHVVKSKSPEKIEISPAVKLKHDRSQADYPNLNLSDGEYVILDVRRHPIGLVPPFAIGIFLLILLSGFMQNSASVLSMINLPFAVDSASISIFAFVMVVFILLGIYVAYYVYTNNKFYLTNESVIQELQQGLFYKSEQTVSLANIEDASFHQKGILQQMFDYGDVRLSTEGDETTYRFSYVAGPKNHVATINNAIEAFKNGEPIDED